MSTKIINLCYKIEGGSAAIGRIGAWLMVPLLVSIGVTVAASFFGVSRFASWDFQLFLLGNGLTINSFVDLQWYIFAILVMLGGALALSDNNHVSVDLFSSLFSPRLKAIRTILGDLIFLIPFCAIMLWFSWGFMASSYASGEGSSYNGLLNRWFIKAVLPLGFSLLLLTGICRIIRLFTQICSVGFSEKPGGSCES